MGILDSVERGLERAVNGAFARTFRSGVQPVEIASALKKQLDVGSVIVDRDRTLAPNRFVVRVSESDGTRLQRMGGQLETELVGVVRKHAARQEYQLLGEPDVEIRVDPQLTTGVLEVDASQVKGGVEWIPALEVDGQRHQLRTGTTVIGRGSDCDIRLNDTGASRQHLQVLWDGKAGLARDLGSTNGSKINGQRFREAALSPGTVITIGQTQLRFQLVPARTQSAAPAQRPAAAPTTAVPSQHERDLARDPQQGSRAGGASSAAPSAGGDSPGIDQDFWRGL
ncbi:phosphopeptide-binding protein [Leucobacter sp. OLJS4]|uniref:FhaA domain-containing protein n=1 Tax=unclassified Leucobacter TaxID=2621730 RepID=UPI000C17F3CE|nr:MULTISPECIES: DUF3662 and FHA domain-containing protein [unclassified Leucobacter]PII82457.1 phosphopeptide-binding protein [Leucobacter sp. OLCALW19]PII87363.1 phosphopeptide-binding protein [Leucobacter sp. OLTLW20]PII94581.1 phosphopeptide-binding protein [Leucobacter sp. OLAS13]PIJ00621.1 phosphopeptide-binding protein [Leucobacter sp. OLDS2]PIJ03116.1 phosphopeptide-binding protein [Leucobacter sp. OLCS4]